jgi:hypothetical protein
MPGPPQSQFLAGQKDPEVAERWAKALSLRKAGASYDQIARQLGYADASGAYLAVQKALLATIQEPADELRQMEIERLDMICLAIVAEVKKGHLGAIDRWLKVSERRAKLLGLDAPQKVAATTPDGTAEATSLISSEAASAIAGLLALAARRRDEGIAPDEPV